MERPVHVPRSGGPPDPAVLDRYHAVGRAKWLLDYADAEQQQRIDQEKKELRSSTRRSARREFMILSSMPVGLLIGGYIAVQSDPWAGAFVAVASISVFAALFLNRDTTASRSGDSVLETHSSVAKRPASSLTNLLEEYDDVIPDAG